MTMVNEVTIAPPYSLYGSLDELLSPETLSRLEGRTVNRVLAEPWVPQAGSASGCSFLRIQTEGSDGAPGRYVVKRTSHSRDLIMRMTEDTACREVVVWQQGLLDRLPPEVEQATLAASSDGDGWALLMRDVTPALWPYSRWPGEGWGPATQEQVSTLLDGLAALHARYWQDPTLLDPTLGLCSLPALYASMAPQTMEREIGSPQPLVPSILRGWALLDDLVPPDVGRITRALFHDLRPLCDALRRYSATLVHGDPKCANVGIALDAGRRVVLLDWQFVTAAPPAVDLSWFLAMFATVLPCSLDEALEEYRAALARRLGSRFSEHWWQPQLDLALLGQFLRMGHMFMDRSHTEKWAPFHDHYKNLLAWWYPHVRAGAALL